MSDDEYEVEAEEKPRGRDEPQLSEAELAMLAAKKKHDAEEEEKLREYEEMRKEQRLKEDEELAELKAKQSRRKEERAEEMRIIAERAQAEEQRRRQEEEERKQRMEEEKRKRDERKKKVGGGGIPGFSAPASGPNFVVTKKEKGEKKGPVGKVGPTKEELEAKKKDFLAANCPNFDLNSLGLDSLKDKVKELHARICKLEADKYDLEKRHESQEYDLKELNERQRQQARNKALAKGLDPEEAANSCHPPKVQVQSKYDRQVDSRSYKERHVLFNDPKKKKEPKLFHGSARPPTEWGRTAVDNEELENVRKNLEAPKYVELAPVEGAKAPMAPVPVSMPELGPDDIPQPKKKVEITVPPRAKSPAPAPEPEPEPEPEDEEEEEEEDAEEEEEEE